MSGLCLRRLWRKTRSKSASVSRLCAGSSGRTPCSSPSEFGDVSNDARLTRYAVCCAAALVVQDGDDQAKRWRT